MLSPALRIALAVWQRHYRIPEWAYWGGLGVALVIGTISLVTGFYANLFDGEAFDRQFVAGISLASINLILVSLCVVGIARWKIDRRRGRNALLVPYFGEWAGAKDRGSDVRAAILDALDNNLTQSEREQVHPIGAVVDLGDKKLASRLLRRLRAQGLVHGRAVDRPGGGWTVHARLVRPAVANITHYDWHTMDRTPARMPWRAWFSRLPSTFEVSDQEFPLELTRDLAALVRALAGATGLSASPAEAETSMREAIATNPASTSAAMDELRLTLAMAVFFQGRREDEALGILRERIVAGNASGELLRAFAFLAELRRHQIHGQLNLDELDDFDGIEAEIEAEEREELEELPPAQRRLAEQAREAEEKAEALWERAHGLDEEEEEDGGEAATLREEVARLRTEIISALETAAGYEDDPRRDLSLYNLITELLSASSEAEGAAQAALRDRAWEKLDLLVDRSPFYRSTWYVKRLLGLRAWMRLQELREQERGGSTEAKSAAKEAAKWYSRAIRSRPRLHLFRREEAPLWQRYRLRLRRSPILDANTFDGHFAAGHKVRARYYEWRFQHRRRALLRDALQDLRLGYLGLARIKVDWAIVGRHSPKEKRKDALENVARAMRERIDEMGEEAHLEELEAAVDNDEDDEPPHS